MGMAEQHVGSDSAVDLAERVGPGHLFRNASSSLESGQRRQRDPLAQTGQAVAHRPSSPSQQCPRRVVAAEQCGTEKPVVRTIDEAPGAAPTGFDANGPQLLADPSIARRGREAMCRGPAEAAALARNLGEERAGAKRTTPRALRHGSPPQENFGRVDHAGPIIGGVQHQPGVERTCIVLPVDHQHAVGQLQVAPRGIALLARAALGPGFTGACRNGAQIDSAGKPGVGGCAGCRQADHDGNADESPAAGHAAGPPMNVRTADRLRASQSASSPTGIGRATP